MIRVARQCGASAKFAGSGGAIVGTYEDQKMLNNLTRRLADISVRTIVPDMSP